MVLRCVARVAPGFALYSFLVSMRKALIEKEESLDFTIGEGGFVRVQGSEILQPLARAFSSGIIVVWTLTAGVLATKPYH